MTVVDLCAGAGGKTLALAAAMVNQGRLIACDIDRARLSRLGPRAERAGGPIIETRLLDGKREAQRLAARGRGRHGAGRCAVFGHRHLAAQSRGALAAHARPAGAAARDAGACAGLGAPLVRPGGRLVYAVCSLLEEEGPAQVNAFLAANPGWETLDPLAAGRPAGPGRRLTPAHDGTDGFFIAVLGRTC